jgi:hypothetical protein
MLTIAHRRNTSRELLATPHEHGVEIDIRTSGSRLILHHDPFKDGEHLETWLDAFDHRFLILNTKEEGLETTLLALMRERGIEDFFFLDQSFPFLMRTANAGERRCAVRVSEYEAVSTALSLAGKVEWVWVDCFTRFPLNQAEAGRLKAAGFKLCLVSPELQGRTDPAEIVQLRELLRIESIEADAVCTKHAHLWHA